MKTDRHTPWSAAMVLTLRGVVAPALVGLLLLVLCLPADASAVEACPNEQLRADGHSTQLPDCRAYEQATPVDKNGVSPQLEFAQASPSGNALTFYSIIPFPVPSSGASTFPTYLSDRAAGAWSTQGLLAPTDTAGKASIDGWSEDLSEVAEQVYGANLPGAAESSNELYLRDSVTGAYQRIADLGSDGASVDSITLDGSHLVFETAAPLLPEAAAGKSNVYEWDSKTGLRLVGLLPASEGGKAPPEGSIAGPYTWLEGDTAAPGGRSNAYYMQNVVSADGSRVLWTATGTGKLYVSEAGASALVGGSLAEPVHFDVANPAGTELLADDDGELVEDAIAPGPTVTATSLTSSASGIQGVLGMSEDGAYVYFVANAVLAANEGAHASHASAGDCVVGQPQEVATCNLYLWHNGQTTFIAPLHTTDKPTVASDWHDWTPANNPSVDAPAIPKSSRVSPGGTVLLFASNLDQTAYDSRGHTELYRYEAPSEAPPHGGLTCVSCDPGGVAPPVAAEHETTEEAEQETTLFAAPKIAFGSYDGPAFLPRNLSADGSRVFFDSSEVLLPQDIDGVRNVYEWEASGSGSCAGPVGCLYLLSTGHSSEPSYFVDASLGGKDAFIDTSQSLVAQDGDELYDIYDARVGGGVAAQDLRSTPCGGEACKPSPSVPPTFQTPVSQAFSGSGNLTPLSESRPARKLKGKPLTRAQKLAKALKRCKREPKKKRSACASTARKRYGTTAKAKKTIRRSK